MTDDYRHALQSAIAAAREAGGLLRQEFLREGGPRGHDDKAPADTEAERLIKARLTKAMPRWSFRGEETGRYTGSDPHHMWLVDPNDGTTPYLQGFRGTATSIGLLRDGEPVLGVVFAYAAPDNEGDLFAWAEGCGPITRNCVPVERDPWATAMERETIAVISQSADLAPRANLELLAPGRYRAEPSIAYRLALIAAGEGDLAIALRSPGAWDYAGGHALLRALGGELVNERGEPVRYSRTGESGTNRCFGGSPHLVREVAGCDWGRVFHRSREAQPPLDLIRPKRGEAIRDNDLLRRAHGCWLGQLTGDALGSMVEFRSRDEIGNQYPDGLRHIGASPVWHTLPGQPTDDSELALALARTLQRDGSFDVESIARSYLDWFQSHPFDVGNTIRRALRGMQEAERSGSSLAKAGESHANADSEANGALMRQSPLAIWGHPLDPAKLDAYVRADTRLTHPNRVCQDASAAFIVALAAVICEGLDAEGAYKRAIEWNRDHGTSENVTKALHDACQAPPDDFSRHAGHVIIALQNAFYQALHASTFEEGVVETVMSGGDTDTNAAIAGALLGAIYGAPAVPSQWKEGVFTCRPQEGIEYVRHPRPRTYWPVDALCLSERLAVSGRSGAAGTGSESTISPRKIE